MHLRWILLALLALAGPAWSQAQFPTPSGGAAQLMVLGCTDAQNRAVPCGAASTGVANLPSPPIRAVPTTCGVNAVGTSSTSICAAGAARSYLFIQNQSDSATLWCNSMGSAATAASPSRKILPNSSWVQSFGFVTTAEIRCISSAVATPIAAEVVQ